MRDKRVKWFEIDVAGATWQKDAKRYIRASSGAHASKPGGGVTLLLPLFFARPPLFLYVN
jgi:hypothetical protein